MSDFVESAKNMVSAAVSRTSWQAQKQLRVRGKQSEIDQLSEQRQQLLDELAQVAMNLYQQGKLTDAQLSRLCASIQELDHDMQNREVQLQEIKSETYNAGQFAPSPTANYTPPPVSPTTPPPNPSFTPPPPQLGTRQGRQGSQGSQGSQGQAPKSATQLQTCPNCGNAVRSNALYCRSCGAKLR